MTIQSWVYMVAVMLEGNQMTTIPFYIDGIPEKASNF